MAQVLIATYGIVKMPYGAIGGGFVIPCLQSGGGFDIRYSLFQSFFFD